jgi:regulator of protease activity HflC (stomatin/prohibitin superfamily)
MLFQNHIPRNRRGLIFKNGDYKRLLLPGSYFLLPGQSLHLFDAIQEFIPPVEWSLLLSDAKIAEELEIVDVLQNEIVLVFQDGICLQLLKPGKHAFWKGVTKWQFRKFDLNQPRIAADLDRQCLQIPTVSEQVQEYVVAPYENGALFIDQKYIEILKPGNYYFWKSPLKTELKTIDLRIQQREIAGQELLTKDRVTLRINFVFQYKVIDSIRVIQEVKDLDEQLYIAFQLALREYIGNLTLDEILQKKEEIGLFVLGSVNPRLKNIGLEATGAGVKDVILPGEIKDIINQVLVAEKRAQANIITRREETASTRNLLNTAKLMEENPVLYRLKELEYMERLTDKVNEINVNGGDRLLDQLRNILMSKS